MISILTQYAPYLMHNAQMLICLLPFVVFLPRRKYIVWLVIAAIASLAIISFLFSLILPPLYATFIFSAVYFIVFNVILGALLFIPFKINGWHAAPIVVGAYAVQSIANSVSLFIITIFNISDKWFWCLALNFGLCAITTVISFFVFALPVKKTGVMGRKDPALAIVSVTAVIIILINSAANYLIFKGGQSFEGDKSVFYGFCAALTCFAAISCFLCLLCLFTLFGKSKLDKEKTKLYETLATEKKRYETLAELQESVNIKVHDMKHILKIWENGGDIGDRRKEIEELKRATLKFESAVDTGNATLDTLIQQDILICDKHGIQFSFIVNGKLIDFIKPPDIVAIFGNALDNAVNYLKTVKNREKRILSLFVKEKLGKVYVCAENYLGNDDIKFLNGLPVTDGDKNEHGFGCKSIKKTALKYNGKTFFTAEHDKFKVEIVFDNC